MLIIGLNHGEANSSAAVFHKGGVRSGAAEERFNRQKLTKLFPKEALEYCLKHVGADLSDADCVAQAWNPGALWRKYNPTISTHRARKEDYFYSVPDNLLNMLFKHCRKY